jgi:hypothetical protein
VYLSLSRPGVVFTQTPVFSVLKGFCISGVKMPRSEADYSPYITVTFNAKDAFPKTSRNIRPVFPQA